MPKPYTFPTLYDDLKTVSISFLSKHGYLKLNQWQSGTITWSRGGNKTGSISIRVNTQTESPFLELDYTCNETPINYRVQLVSAPSNLGKGVVWYFICPHTKLRCRKLYLVGTYFYHRSAFRGCMYEKQTYSKKVRIQFKQMDRLFGGDKVYDLINSKNFKREYRGKLTKRYKKMIKLVNEQDNVSLTDIL